MKVFMYHNIATPPKGAKLKSMYVKPEKLETQIKVLKKLGYNFVRTDQLEENPKKAILLTFDDGYKDFYESAFPILKKYSISAIVFIPVGYVGTFNQWDYEKLNVKKPLMNWEEIREIHKHGIEIGSHTLTHPFLTKIPKEKAKVEIEDSKKMLEDKLSTEINSFCYPYGDYDERIRDLVMEAGYKYAFTTKEGSLEDSENLYEIRRKLISGYYSLPRVLWKAIR